MAKSSFGGSVKLQGETEYRRALKNINDDLKLHSAELKAVAAQFDVNDKSVENLTKQNEVLNKSIDDQKKRVEVLRKALASAKLETGSESETTRKWQTDLYKAEAELGKLNNQLNVNERDMKAAKEATDDEKRSLKELGSASDSTESKLEALSKGMKVAAAAAAAIGAAAVAAGKKLWNMANDVAAAGDEIDKMSQKIGISAKSYQEWDYVFSRSGADINKLETGMKKLSNVIDDASKGSDSATKALAAVGLTIDDLNGKSQDEQLSIVIGALQEMEAGAARTAAASDLFGKSATDMAAVLNMTAEETEALKKEAEDYGMIMSDDAVKASAAFEDSLRKLKGTVTGVKNEMVGELLPGITKISDGFSDLVAGNEEASEKIKEGADEIVKSLSDMIPKALDFASSIATAVLENAPTILSSLADGLITNLPKFLDTALNQIFPKLVTTALSIVKRLISTLSKSLPTLLKSLAETLVKILQDIFGPENIQETIGIILDFVKNAVAGLQQALPILIQGVIDLADGLIKALPDIMSQILNEIPTLIGMLSDTLQTTLPQLIDGVIKLIDGLVTQLPTIITSIVEAIPSIITSIIDAVSKALPQIINGACRLIEDLVKNIPTIIASLIDAIPQIIDMIFDSEDGILSPKNIGLLLDGVVDAVTELFKHIDEIISGIISAIPKIISSLFDQDGQGGFFSPSNITSLVQGAANLVAEILTHLDEIVGSLIAAIPEIIKSILSSIANFFGSGPEKMDLKGHTIEEMEFAVASGNALNNKPLEMAAGNAAEIYDDRGISGSLKYATNLGSNISDKVLLLKEKRLSKNAEGGIALEPTVGMIGDNGPEAIIPLKNNLEWIDRVAERFYRMTSQATGVAQPSTTQQIYVTFGDVTVTSDADIDDVAQRMSQAIAREVLVRGGSWA